MRTTRTWTISLPPQMSRVAERVAGEEHRTKSELVREALRRYIRERAYGGARDEEDAFAQAEVLTDIYRQRHRTQGFSEAELRRQFRPIRRLHNRLKRLRA